ncbi:biofilm regulation phosphoprotein SiaC [Azovibrio restrictus]|uniref:biofilm regulation phosphoprotein SiaC n=1 Tax=Azovibrio restrictus TaxID=146938 RepID=UPI0026EA3F29|nr:biofilm regulation phosphoprotein SiaC [Azovibrio restrictus]MDD3482866.1 biofilm regulation phosphoprotein SiaC [Azovibrio restrictus]
MNDLNIQGSQSTPHINSDSGQGLLSMQGDSYPENSFEFFGPVIAWIETYLRDSQAPLRLELRLVYMNTSSVKAMMDIFDLLEEAHGQGRQVSVDWFYDPRNERVLDLADEFREDCTFPFLIAPDSPFK